MVLKLLATVLLIKIVVARIKLDVNIDQETNISHSGREINIITDDDIKIFNIKEEDLLTGLEKYVRHKPHHVDPKNRRCDFDLVSRVLSVKSARVKSLTKKPIILMSQNFENKSSNKIKVNTGISHSVQNTLTTSWSREKEFTVSQEIEYEFSVLVAGGSGTTGFSFKTEWGDEEEKSISEIVGTTSGTEIELKPGDAVTAVLSANAGALEIEVEYKNSLTGLLCYIWQGSLRATPIDKVMNSANINNEIVTTQTVKFSYYVESDLKVYDSKTGLLI